MVIIVLETPSRLSLAFEVDILPTGRLGRKKKNLLDYSAPPTL